MNATSRSEECKNNERLIKFVKIIELFPVKCSDSFSRRTIDGVAHTPSFSDVGLQYILFGYLLLALTSNCAKYQWAFQTPAEAARKSQSGREGFKKESI